MKRFALIGLLASSALFGLAQAQNYIPQNNPIPVPLLQNTTQTDVVQDIARGQPGAQSQYVTLGQIAGAPSYALSVPVTGFSQTFAANQDIAVLTPAGTLAAGTETAALVPSDAQTECVDTTQTITSFTFSANTGATVVGASTSPLAIGVSQCWQYVAPLAEWIRYK